MRRALTALQVGLVIAGVVGASSVSTLTAESVLGAASRAAAGTAGGIRAVTAGQPSLLRGTRRTVLRFRVAGLRRELVEVAPIASGRPLALVVVLHGRRQTPWRAERVEGWDALAATGQAVVAYGAGYAGSWNAGRCCGRAAARHVDDQAYLLRVLQVVRARQRIDPTRVYLVGFSNGGMLAYRFACAHATAIAAFAVVAGALEVPSCRPARGVAVLAVTGARDRVVPYAGSRLSVVAGAPITSAPESLRAWAALRRQPGDVQLVRLPGVGHEWPTRPGWDATSRIWRFLAAHRAETSSR